MSEVVDLESLKADVALFAAGLGLASQDGFNDADFRKKGPLKKRRAETDQVSNASDAKPVKVAKKKRLDASNEKNVTPRGGKRGPFRNAENATNGSRPFDKKKDDISPPKEIPPEKDSKFAKQVSHTFGSRWGGTGEKWYETAAGIASKMQFIQTDKATGDDFIRSKREEAESLLKRAALEFEQSRKSDSDMRWILSARRSGTSGDKVAAMTVLIQENPLANLQTLDNLLGMVTSKGGKRHALAGIDLLKELFITSLLPDRKLKYFSNQPLATLPDTKEGASLILFWFWEDCMKHRYEQFVNAVVEGSKDTLIQLKLKSVKTLYELLKAKPELERKLLAALINKLGDPERKVASNASYFLSCLLTEHPNMKKIVIQEVELFVFRPNVGMRAIYYASVFMNHLLLSNKDEGPNLAKRLIDIYFGLFNTITSKEYKHEAGKVRSHKHKNHDKAKDKDTLAEPTELDSRLLSALLTGVNRAFPFVTADDADTIIQEHTPSLFRLVHSPNFNVGVQALMLLYQLLVKHQAVSDRFYRALYSVLLSPSLTKSSKVEMFLALLFKVLKSDISSSRICAFMKRLMQVALHQPPQFGCASLVLLSEILKAKPLLWNAVLEPTNEDEDDEHFKDVELPDETETSVKSEPANKEVASADIDSDSDISVDNELQDLGDDDSNSDDEVKFNKKTMKKKEDSVATQSVGPRHSRNEQAKDLGQQKTTNAYDPRHRDPLYCKAEHTCWWELTILSSHIHPSVSTMARTLLSNANVIYSGDPLHDLALGAFLDRFAEKKPKAPRKTLDNIAHHEKREAASNAAVGMKLASLPEDEVAPADMIFHRFYCAKATGKGKRKKQKKNVEMDTDAALASDDENDEDEDHDFGEEDGSNAFVGGDTSIDEADDNEEDNASDGDEDVDGFVQGDDSEDEEIDNLLDEEAGMEFSDGSEEDLEQQSDDDDFEFGDYQPIVQDGKDEPIESESSKKKKKKQEKTSKASESVDIVVDDEAAVVSKKKQRKSMENGGGIESPVVSKRKGKKSMDDDTDDGIPVVSKRKGKKSMEDDIDGISKRKGKKGEAQASPFASAEEYAHLFT